MTSDFEEPVLTVLDPAEVPELEGWIAMSDAADMLGMSRQGLHQQLFIQPRGRPDKPRGVPEIKTVCKVGKVSPIYLFRLEEVQAEDARREKVRQGIKINE